MPSLTRLLATAALSASLTFAAYSQAADTPTTAPAPTTKKAEKPAPTPIPKIVVLKLSNTLTERPADFTFSDFTNTTKSYSLSQLIITLNKAAKDKSVGGVLLELKSFDLSLNQAQEVGYLLQKLRAAQKRVVIFAPDFDTPTYLLASYADTVIMPENGDLMIPGVHIGLMFFRGLLDKINIYPDFVQIGKFKGAEEPFVRNDASPEFKEQIDGLVDGMYGQLVSTIAANRKQLEEKEITSAIDEGWIPGKRAKELQLVDKLMSREQVEDWINDQFPNGADTIDDYNEPKKKNLDMDNPFAIFSLFTEPPAKTKTTQPAVAIIYADGEITGDGPEGSDDNTTHVTPGRIRKAVDKALNEPLVKSIVLRVDSPGGGATASDEIWQILKEADKSKPITVSMGRVAASGGYYISCAGRSISADPATITGSIGVVGGKIVLKGLADKIGVNIQDISKGKHADMFSTMSPFSDEERAFIQNLMTDTYKLFTDRVKAGRGDKIKNIEDVAQGRLFTGPAAQTAGLVDEVRTLPETVQASAKAAGIANNYQIIVYPEQRTIADIIRESFTPDAKLPLEFSTALTAIPPEYRNQTLNMLSLLHVMQSEHLLLTAPIGITEK